MLSYVVPFLLWASLKQATVQAQQESSTTMSTIFLDNTNFWIDTRNFVNISYPVLQSAFKHPNATIEIAIDPGLDWTKPFPGTKIAGHKTHLRVAHDVELPEEVVQDSTTSVSSLTWSIPDAMMDVAGGRPKAMHPSWFICRHIYVSQTAKAAAAASGGGGDSCGFLAPNCVKDLKNDLTKGWMTTDEEVPCSGSGFDLIPQSCEDTFGFVRADVMAFDSEYIAIPSEAQGLVTDKQTQHTWRMGTGFHDKGDKRAYEAAANRTYLIVTVWGYSDQVGEGNRRTPETSLTCLSGAKSYGNTNAGNSTSSSTTTATLSTS